MHCEEDAKSRLHRKPALTTQTSKEQKRKNCLFLQPGAFLTRRTLRRAGPSGVLPGNFTGMSD